MKQPADFIALFQLLGSASNFEDLSCLQDVQRFVCVLWQKNSYNVNKVRSELFQSKYSASQIQELGNNNGIDLSLLPPCADTLALHCDRANYQSFIWKNVHRQYYGLEEPEKNGWCHDKVGCLQINWVAREVVPTSVVDILADSSNN